MRMSQRWRFALPLALVSGLWAQEPLEVLSVDGNGSTFSLDRLDPDPTRSLWAVFEVNRRVDPREVQVVQEREATLNAAPVSARCFQRGTPRGTHTVWVEVKARPLNLGKAARIAFQVRLGGALAGTIETATPLLKPALGKPLFYAEADGNRDGFYLVYPIGARVTAKAQSVNPIEGRPWEEQAVVYPEWISCHWGANFRAHFELPRMTGLVNVYAEMAGGTSYAQVVYVNLPVSPREWAPVTVSAE